MFLSAQNQNDLFKTINYDPRINDSLIWQKEREAARLKKIQEQNQVYYKFIQKIKL